MADCALAESKRAMNRVHGRDAVVATGPSRTHTIVNFGCGPFATPGYINVDGSPTVLLAKLPLPASWLYAKADFVQAARQAQGQVWQGEADQVS
jgi:hypothetical protein